MDAILKKPKQLAAPTPKPQKPDLSTELEQAKIRITRLEREVKDLKNEVDYLKEERDDVRGWLDKNTRSGSTGVYEKLGRMLH
jgi:predicted  nucleic acid-binding Zn-ribbon protein